MIDRPYKHRKGSTTLTLLNKDRSPIKNQELVIDQIGHSFLFGSSEFDCIPYVNGDMDSSQKERAEEMFEKFFPIFNFATLPFYWGSFEPEEGKPDTDRLKKTALWLKSKGLKLKGHPLCWHTVAPPWLLDMDNNNILWAQLDRINREVTDFKGLIDIWDLINEAVIMPLFDKYDNGISRICNDLGRIGLIRKVFSTARKANQEATLLINDFETSEAYDILIEGCLESGIQVDEIGIQSHMHQGYWGLEKLQEILGRFSRFNLPIHFTENTIVSGHIMPPEIGDYNDYQNTDWPSTPEGEERQAEETITHYKALFAHPLVQSITWWNFVDGRWLGAPGGFLRADNSAKPVYDEINKLINKEWHTGPVKLATDNNGSVNISGFLGQYELNLLDTVIDFNLDKKSPTRTIIL
ncbi:MAG TPA: endo-1,4-beta-xylanase [Bacillota bacterium]|nr:endo-1,4-beta-xylanase [Bacillota bacterium]